VEQMTRQMDAETIPARKIRLCHCDPHGLKLALVSTDGFTPWHAEYDERENLLNEDNPHNLTQHLRLQGQHYDEETGLHYNHHRYYDPALGRYISQDPIGLRGGWNNYVYTTNPLSQVDPFGLETKVIVNNNGLGHVGVYTGSGNDAIIYDPGGSFTTPQGIPAGSGDVFYGEEADLGRYLEYQYIDGDDVTVYTFNTTKEEEDKLKIIIDEQGGCAPLLCSTCSGSALRQLERFKSLGSTRTPWGMKSEMETILNN
jgi:RHS repeat-associated protein